MKKSPSPPVNGQVTIGEWQHAQTQEKLAKRVACAKAICGCINKINRSNRAYGATDGFGMPNPRFDFEAAYGSRVNKHGEYTKGMSFKKVAELAAESAKEARQAAKHACEICEYAKDCAWHGKLFSELRSPERARDRQKLARRKEVVINSGGKQNMSCIVAIKSSHPKQTDWDW